MMQLTKNIKLTLWFNFLIALRPYASVAIIYFSRVTHSYALGISIFSITQLAQAVFEIPTGIYSDILGRRNCLIIGASTSVLSVLFYAIGHSYLFLALGAILQGAYFAFFNGNNSALLYETLAETGQKEKYHEVLGKAINLLIYEQVYTRAINIIALAFPTIASPFLMTSTSLFYGVGEVAQNTLLQQQLTDRQRATMPSINSLLGSCFFALFAFLIGFIADKIGSAKTLLLAQLCLIPIIWLYMKVFHTSKELKQ